MERGIKQSANGAAALSQPKAALAPRSDRKNKPVKGHLAGKPAQSNTSRPGEKTESGPQAGDDNLFDRFIDPLISFFTSIRLTVVCLGIGMVLVFWGTIAQVDLGLYKAQNEFFRSFFIYWGPKWTSWKIPIFPGGYLVGGVLLINLVSAHIKRFKVTRDKAGIWMVHFGLITLLLGQLLTDLLARESMLHLREGESKNYSESDRQVELAVIDSSDAELDKVVAIPHRVLASRQQISHPDLPFTIHVNRFMENSRVTERKQGDTSQPPVTQDVGTGATLKEMPKVTDSNLRDMPSAVIEISTTQGSLGTWLVSLFIRGTQTVTVNNHDYQLVMRPRRFYKPYALKLLKFTHDVYAGTDIPKNFASRVMLQRADTGENREIDIHMNAPLRYAGETYYQASLDQDDHGTVLQVVRNPSWLTPYFSCVLVGFGLIVQFATHLLGFTLKKKPA